MVGVSMKWLDVFRVRDGNKRRGGGVGYKKAFDRWNEVKKNLHESRARTRFNEREIWWCRVGVNVGYEIDGKQELFLRPVLILKKMSTNTFVGVPLTKKKEDSINRKCVIHSYYVLKENVHGYDGEVYHSVLDLSQIRLFDARRLLKRQRRVRGTVFSKIQSQIRNMLC